MVLFRGNQFNFLSEKPLLRTNKCSEHKKNTTNDPCFYCCQSCKDKRSKKSYYLFFYVIFFFIDEDLQGKSWFNGKEFFNIFKGSNKPSALGIFVVMVLKMLTRTRNMVIRSVIRPGTTSGGIRNEIQDTMTNIPEGR